MQHLTAIALTIGWLGLSASGADFDSERLQNWHHWRGPNADGTAPSGNPPVTWDENTNVKWKVEIPGRGSATPIVWGNRVFILTAVEAAQPGENDPAASSRDQNRPGDTPRQELRRQETQGQAGRRGRGGRGRGGFGGSDPPSNPVKFMVLCLDRRTGQTLWERQASELVPHEGFRAGDGSFASGSPTTNGQHLFAYFGSYGIYCYDFDGNLIWNRDLGNMQTRNRFGEGASPTWHGDTLAVNWDHEGDSFIAALDAKTGETRWEVARDEVTTWATPLIVEHGGRTQVVTNGANRVRSYDLGTGELIWECGGQASNPIPSPVAADGLVYCMTGYRGFAVYAIPLEATGDITDTDKIAWYRTDSGPYVSSPVLYEDVLYHTKDRTAVLSVLNTKTGEPVIGQTRLPELETLYASPVAAADRVYFTDRNGTTLVIKHGPELEVLATNKLGEGIDASPAIVGKEMFLRGEKHLYCIAEP